MSFADDMEGGAEGGVDVGDDGNILDGRTPLDKTIDRIGMGAFYWLINAHTVY